MKRRVLLSAVALAIVPLVSACATHPGAQVKSNMETMRREQTPEKLFERGKAFASVGDLTRAEQYLSAALDQGGDEAKITPVLIEVCVAARKYRVAIEYGEDYLRRHPADQQLRFVVGTLYWATSDPEAARAKFQQIVDGDPKFAEAHYALGVVFRDVDHDVVSADHEFRDYLRLSPSGAHVEDARASLLKAVP